MNNDHELEVKNAINRAFEVLKIHGFVFRPMNRTKPISRKKGYIEGHTSLKNKTITIDIYTARFRKPKKISAILAVLAHEIAHHQKSPYRQRYQGRIINRFHYPRFYKQTAKNIEKFKKDEILKEFYK